MAENIVNMAITVDDGSRRVPIQNKFGEEIGAFTFHPTDIGIIERYNDMVSAFDAITEPLQALDGGAEDADEEGEGQEAEALREARKRLYEAVDKLFNSDGAAREFFGNMHPFSPVGGLFYCEHVLQAVGAYISGEFKTETAKLSSRVEKYTKNRAQRRAKK